MLRLKTQGISKPRNRVIARFFQELDMVEQWGSVRGEVLLNAPKVIARPVVVMAAFRGTEFSNRAGFPMTRPTCLTKKPP
jgi:hypothetical protein